VVIEDNYDDEFRDITLLVDDIAGIEVAPSETDAADGSLPSR
jgi:hypothetical protein